MPLLDALLAQHLAASVAFETDAATGVARTGGWSQCGPILANGRIHFRVSNGTVPESEAIAGHVQRTRRRDLGLVTVGDSTNQSRTLPAREIEKRMIDGENYNVTPAEKTCCDPGDCC